MQKVKVRETITISRWKNVYMEKQCALIRKETMTCAGTEVFWRIDGYNPLPVKGWFSSSWNVLERWLVANDWVLLASTHTTREIIREIIE